MTEISKKNIEKGVSMLLTYTQPMYDKKEQKYLPDNFRFVEPDIVEVFYGGREPEPRYCRICGRKAKDCSIFLRASDLKEIFISRHCLQHDSTRLWSINTPTEEIKTWYDRESLERGAKAGDPLAGLALALEELENEEDY